MPYIRWKNQSGHSYQIISNGTEKFIRLETNRNGSWENLGQFVDYRNTFFLPGNTFTSSGWGVYIFGHVTTAGKDLRISIPLPKLTNLVTGATVTTLKVGVRIPAGGYITGDVYDYKSSITHIELEGSFIHINCRNDNGWGVTNNIPVTGLGDFACTFS